MDIMDMDDAGRVPAKSFDGWACTFLMLEVRQCVAQIAVFFIARQFFR